MRVSGQRWITEEEFYTRWLLEKYGVSGQHPPTGKVYKWERERTPHYYQIIPKLKNVIGVYSFCDRRSVLYVGKSISLGERIPSSFSERFKDTNTSIWFRYIRCFSESDAALLEMFYINKFKPPLNESSKYQDRLTLTIKPLPKFGDKILITMGRKR